MNKNKAIVLAESRNNIVTNSARRKTEGQEKEESKD